MTGWLLLGTLESTDGGIRYLIFFATLLPAAILASRKSTYLVDYYIVVVCLNRFVRRVLDWAGGEYDPRPISSLLPLLIGVMMLAVAAWQLPRFPRRYRQAFYLLLAALGYGAAVGVGNGMAMFHSLLEYLTPMGLLFYGLAIRADLTTLDRWLNTIAKVAVGVALYGWYQWATIPPWFAAWIEWSGMWSSMGRPVPFKTAICSTLESRGPFAWFMAMSAIPMLALPRWRKGVGLPGALLVVSAILPSTVRSAWGILAVGLGALAMIRGGQGWARIVAGLVVAIAALMVLKSNLPQSEQLFDRLESVTELSNDRSFQTRSRIAQEGIWLAFTNPLGYGIGSSGLASKVSGDSRVIGDNGVLELLTTFGVAGLVLLMAGIKPFVTDMMPIAGRYGLEHAALSLAQFMAGMSAMAFSNWVPGAYSGLVLMIFGAVVATASASSPTCTVVHTQTRQVV